MSSVTWFKTIFRLSRWQIILFSLLIISGLMFLSHSQDDDRYAEKINHLQNPENFRNTPICLSHVRLISVDGNVFGIDRRGTTFPLRLTPEQTVMMDQRYSVKGIIQADGKILVQEFQHHPLRLAKYLFSSLSLLLIGILIYRHIRINTSSCDLHFIENRDDNYLFGK